MPKTPKFPKYPILVRENKRTNHIELYMYDGSPEVGFTLTCYDCYDKYHIKTHHNYILTETRPVSPEVAMKYFNAYLATGTPLEGCVPVLVERLPIPRKK